MYISDLHYEVGKCYRGTNRDGTYLYFKVINIQDCEIAIEIIRDYDSDSDIRIHNKRQLLYGLNENIDNDSSDCFIINAKPYNNKEKILAMVL